MSTEAEVFQQAVKDVCGKLTLDVIALQSAYILMETKALELEAENTELKSKLAEIEKQNQDKTPGQVA